MDELAFVAYRIWRGMGRWRDAWYANRLAPIAIAYWAAPEPDPAVVVKR